ncbi:MAG TPA: YCF48-related protein [Pyrinomonadaceae bacterium]|nr:YCF48-related protein [Pyrinomonadaceae bacterium]
MRIFGGPFIAPLQGAQLLEYHFQGQRAKRLSLATIFRAFGTDHVLPSAFCLLSSAFCLLLSAFCLLPSAYGSTWTRQQSGTMAWLHAVYFLDQNRGWVAGSGGTLLATDNSGRTWKKLFPLTKDNLRDVYFASEKNGWLVCEHDPLKLKSNDEPRAYLLKTTDGGSSWQRVNLAGFDVNARLVRAVFADAERGWVFGESGVVFNTRDGGAHWVPQPLPTKHLLLGGAFVDYRHGWLVGAGATIVQTTDGGATWKIGFVRDGASARFTAASFIGNNLGWAVGTEGRVFATTDGGGAWFAQRSNAETDLSDVRFVDASEGWVAGAQGTLLRTTDGGLHWSPEPSGTTHALERLFFIDRDHGWAVGFGGIILTYAQAGAPRLKS